MIQIMLSDLSKLILSVSIIIVLVIFLRLFIFSGTPKAEKERDDKWVLKS